MIAERDGGSLSMLLSGGLGLRVGLLFLVASSVGCLMEVDLGTNLVPGDDDDDVAPVDLDEDGFTEGEGDCDDLDEDRAPDLRDVCDGVDNDCDDEIDLDEAGHDDCARRERFTQAAALDLLLVADRSESATSILDRAAAAVPDLVDHLVGPAFETHLGVITMDMSSSDQQGRLIDVSGRRWVSGSTDSPVVASTFLSRALTDAGVQGDGPEGGRAALDAALFDHADGWNAGFARNGVPLVVVFLSDDEDRSEAPSATELTDSLDAARDLSNVTLHAVVQVSPMDCDLEASPGTEGRSYQDLAVTTNGFQLSVCEKDYGPFFTAVGQYAAIQGLKTRFPLHAQPVAESVRVTLYLPDGGGVHQLSQGEFGLTDLGRTLVLLTDPPPLAKTEIVVDYREDPR